ncbi:lipoprotein, putative [Geotalea daltonii FRC-32]|uniref:Lipoprotein, putative n=1 Tax=Geotalea daltonii (strain DSM 22248 / JCM 15807 / FRC-32) TaxID=316067 RepID=B9M5V7_GEODF|nr:hypothetical protein [Geotalea daltonii]ACM19938.1 lipoprotein, putative [Geotalea daltonii FRC-32]
MRHLFLVLLLICPLSFAGCSGDNGKQLLETAQFEEKQHNLEHAKQLYGEIVRKYPGTESGRQAEERLKTLK